MALGSFNSIAGVVDIVFLVSNLGEDKSASDEVDVPEGAPLLTSLVLEVYHIYVIADGAGLWSNPVLQV